MPYFDLNDKTNVNAEITGAIHPVSCRLPAVPCDVKVWCNRPNRYEAICWKDPTFFKQTEQKPIPAPLMNSTNNSTMTHSVDIPNSSVDESSDGTPELSANQSSGNTSSDSKDMDFCIRNVDDIIIESGHRISFAEKNKKSKIQMASSITTIRAMEKPIAESIYAPAKFETNVNTKRLGRKAGWASIPQHSFLGLRYTTYDCESNTFRRKRVAVGAYGDKGFTDLCDDSDTQQAIGTQSDISYDKLIDVMKSIPKYFLDKPKFKLIKPRFSKANNCNSFVYSMATQAGLSDIAQLHHTISPGNAANNILDYMNSDESDLSRVRVELDGTKSKSLRRSVFIQKQGIVSLGLEEDEFIKEAYQAIAKDSKKGIKDPDLTLWIKNINTLINQAIDTIRVLYFSNDDERLRSLDSVCTKFSELDSSIIETIRSISKKYKMLKVYLIGILNFFHTAQDELGLLSSSDSPEFFIPKQIYATDSETSTDSEISSASETSTDSETSHIFSHYASAQTVLYFKNLLNDASFKNYTKDLLKLAQEDTAYNDNLSRLILTRDMEQLRKAGYNEKNSKTLAAQTSQRKYIKPMNKNIKIQASFLNSIILGNYESDFTTLMKSLKRRNPKKLIDASDVYYKILKLYQAALNDRQNQRSIAEYIKLYQEMEPKKNAVDQICNDLYYHLRLTLLNEGVTLQHNLQKMFSCGGYSRTKQGKNFLHKNLDTVEEHVQKTLNTKKRKSGCAKFDRKEQYVSLLASNAKTILYGMISQAIYNAQRGTKHTH